MPSRYPVEVRRQVVELARSGTWVAQLAETFGMSEAVICGWLRQERIDRGEAPGLYRGADGARCGQEAHSPARDGTGGLEEGERGVPRAESAPKASSR
jgi:transposase-like protein